MLRGLEDTTAFLAQLDKEYRSIGENWELNRQAWERIQNGAKHVLDWSALGYTLHIVYTAMENYFLRISKVFENNLPRESWHKELLERMQLELPGIRPALLDRDAFRLVDELRAFRHVFRGLYDERLDPERLSLLQRKAPRIQDAFSKAHERFCTAVAELAIRDDPS